MAENFFNTLQCILKLIAENKLKKDIDDTLLEKLLTLIEKSRLLSSDAGEKVIVVNNKNDQDSSDFILEMIKKTDVLYFIEKVLVPVDHNDNKSTITKSFFLRLFGLLSVKSDYIFHYGTLLPLLKNLNGTLILNYNPSVQDALLFCLLCFSKKYDGAIWFVSQDLKDFVFSSFNSSSYYVRKSSVKFFTTFILQWTSYLSVTKQKKPEELNLENFIKNCLSFIIDHIHFYKNSEEMVFAECCISILKQILESENSEYIIKNTSNLFQRISDCFLELSDEDEFNNKLASLFLTVHSKLSLQEDSINDVVKCLIINGDIKLAMNVASSFVNKSCSKLNYSNGIKFFMLPVYILLHKPLMDCESFFGYNAVDAHHIISKKMEDKSACKLLFTSSLSALTKIVAKLDLNLHRHIALELLDISRCSASSHKWLYFVLDDRLVHHSLIEFYSSLLSDDVYCSFKYENTDLIFQTILEYLKKSTVDSNFLSQLLLLMKKVLSLQKKYEFDVEENEKSDLIQIICRNLLDKRESVVDSAIHLSGEITKNVAWQDKLTQEGIHSIIWDIAFQGNLDGSTRSTALKVIMEGCQEEWCLSEIKSLKNLTDMDIAKKLFDLTYDSDFFLQREALSCLFLWTKAKWDELPSLCNEYLYVSLVSGIESLDLELKLLSLDIWKWLLENKLKFSIISPSLNLNDYINYLATCGFGLSLVLSLEDYDQAVQYKAASILIDLKNVLTSQGSMFESLKLDSFADDGPKKCIFSDISVEPVSKEDKDKGIDTVMELSTFEQIANICHPLCDNSDSKRTYFPVKRTCTVSSFWTCLWSENIISILDPVREILTDEIDAESVFNDIKLASVIEAGSVEDIPDCY